MARYKKDDARFSGNMPLFKYVSDRYPDKLDLKYNYFEPPKDFSLIFFDRCQYIDVDNKRIIFGVKATEEELIKYDFLYCTDGGAFIVHERVLSVMNDLCPNDFQALPVTIKNLKPDCPQPFENHDFYLINILKKYKIFENSSFWYTPNGTALTKKEKKVINGSMEDSLLARDIVFPPSVFFHPTLAKHFIKSKGVQFLTAEEAP